MLASWRWHRLAASSEACPRRLLPAEGLSGALVWLQVASASQRSSEEVSRRHLPRLLAAASQVPGQTALLALHAVLRIVEAARAAVLASAASVAAGQGQQGLTSHDPLAHQAQAVLAAVTPVDVDGSSKGAGVAPQPEEMQVEPQDQSLAQLAGSAASMEQGAGPPPGAVQDCQEVQLQILRQLLMFPRAQSPMPEEVRSSVGYGCKCMLGFIVV